MKAQTAAGNEYEVVEYADPFPGKLGSDLVRDTCAKCSGTGVVNWGNVTYVVGGVEDRHCFDCNGKGYTTRKVSSARSTARRQAKAATLRNYQEADWEAERPAREAAEREAAHELALQEEARRNNKAKGFLGAEGERLRNLNAQVTGIYTYEARDFRTGQPTTNVVVKFDVLGKVAVWFTGWTTLEVGNFVSLTGTVKALNTRDGEEQTILTRCITK